MNYINGTIIYSHNLNNPTNDNDKYFPNKYICQIIPILDTLKVDDETKKDEIYQVFTKRIKINNNNQEVFRFTPSDYPFAIYDLSKHKIDESIYSGAKVLIAFKYKETDKDPAMLIKGIMLICNGIEYNPFDEIEECISEDLFEEVN